MLTKTEAIKIFLQASTYTDLAVLYNAGMECQVNVAQDGGEKTEGEFHGKMWHGFTDGATTWKSFRIPRNANSKPEYVDTPMRFSLTDHAEGIGMTGWDWKNSVSRWVAYDFDAITGHSDRHQTKITEDTLDEVRLAAQDIEWVTVRKSSSGRGLHLYVFLDPPIPTANHNEHAALARAILGKMSARAKTDFDSKVDICGQNMWIWHRKMKDTEGLSLVKKGVPLDSVPPQWKDHIKVITRHRGVTLPQFIKEASADNSLVEQLFLELTGQSVRIPLDEEHKRLIQYLDERKTGGWWDSDHHMLVTHTFNLKEAHLDLRLRGLFETLAVGKDSPTDINCYAFPMRNGSWSVRRYSMGCQEHQSWTQDGGGWTQCYFNRIPDLGTAARTRYGIEKPSGGYVFKEAESAIDAAKSMGIRIPEVAPSLRTARSILKMHKDGARLIVEIEGDPDRVARNEMDGWLYEKSSWKRMFPLPAQSPMETESVNCDELIRHLITNTGQDYGWVIKGENGLWQQESLVHVTKALESMGGINPKEIKNIIGSSVIKPWALVNLPFQPEYPGNRRWNRDAVQFRFTPSINVDDLEYPHWKRVFDHCGAGLDSALQENAWARANGIKTGGDYLKIWVASALKEPTEPLPYLFFFGTQNNGKSTFHEAISLLVTQGCKRAEAALISSSGFNEELKNAVFCVIEEIDLRKNKDANNRIKDWVTAREISIHPKGRTPYHMVNTMHWIQCANEGTACPTFPGDTRITMIYVPDLSKGNMIPKKALMPELEKEAPDFLAELLRLEIPASNDRLNVPVITTAEKREALRMNETPLQQFLREKTYKRPGHHITKGQFFEYFREFVNPAEAFNWTKQRISREMPPEYPQGRLAIDGNHAYGNISFEAPNNGELELPLRAESRPTGSGKEETYLVKSNGHR